MYTKVNVIVNLVIISVTPSSPSYLLSIGQYSPLNKGYEKVIFLFRLLIVKNYYNCSSIIFKA